MVTHMYVYVFFSFFRFFSCTGYYNISGIVPCAMQWVLPVLCVLCVSVYPNRLMCPFVLPFVFEDHRFDFHVCASISVLPISSPASLRLLLLLLSFWLHRTDLQALGSLTED